MRLGFAVATALEPDTLLLDEVLAVGDASFRNRCYNRIGIIKKSSCIILVSHNMDQVGQFCDRLLVLSHGHAVYEGEVADGIAIYEDLQRSNGVHDDMTFENVAPPVTDVRISLDPVKVSYGSHVRFRMEVDSERPVFETILKIVLYDQNHYPCAEWNSERLGHAMSLSSGTNLFNVTIGPLMLKTGRYRLGVVLNDESCITMLVWSFKKHDIFVDSFTALGPPVALSSALQ